MNRHNNPTTVPSTISLLKLGDCADQALLLRSEADYFKMRWEEAQSAQTQTHPLGSPTPATCSSGSPGPLDFDCGKAEFTAMARGYLAQIGDLQRQLDQARCSSGLYPQTRLAPARRAALSTSHGGGIHDDPPNISQGSGVRHRLGLGLGIHDDPPSSAGANDDDTELLDTNPNPNPNPDLTSDDTELLDADFSLSVARVIAQTREQLQRENLRLHATSPDRIHSAEGAAGAGAEHASLPPSSPHLDAESDETRLAVVQEEAYQQRQRGMRSEVLELGESIVVKEQLIAQLQRSQYQYDIMKVRIIHSVASMLLNFRLIF